MKKTSETHPLRIDAVPVGHLGGLIGMTLCPGKRDALALSGEWERDLDTDLREVAEWGASVVVSLMEQHEFSMLGVPDFARHMPAGIEHLVLPIVDGGVPSGTWERAWTKAGPSLREKLALGGRILIHCRGGLGRTGIVAARLLVEFGEEPVQAMLLVRKARPDAIENRRQEAYVLHQRPLQSALQRPVVAVDPAKQARFRGCLLAGAAGDALGAPVEFLGINEIRARYGPAGIRDYAPYAGRTGAITDDTQLTLFTAEGLLRAASRPRLGSIAAEIPDAVAQSYQRWLVTQGDTSALSPEVQSGWLICHGALFSRRAPGLTCLTALRKMARYDEVARNDSKGCGGVMRMAPVGLFVHGMGLDPQAAGGMAFGLGCELAAITHGHPAGQHPAGVLAALVVHLLHGASLPEALAEAKALLMTRADHEETLAAINLAVRLAADSGDGDNHLCQLGQGWVAEEALAIAIYCALRSDSVEEGVILAVNLTGDSDSTGAIAGNLLGTLYGVESIPQRWLERLELREEITVVADDLLSWPEWKVGDHTLEDVKGKQERACWADRYPFDCASGRGANGEPVV